MKEFLKHNARPAFGFLFVLLSLYAVFIAPPFEYPKGSAVAIPPGTTIQGASEILEAAHAVRFAFVFSLAGRVLGPNTGVIANTYALPGRENAIILAYRLTHGETDTTPVKVTIPEGLSSREIGATLGEKLGVFDVMGFDALAKQNEGYLFPETYYFLPGTAPEAVIQIMRDTFDAKIAPLQGDITASGKSLNEIITMASILEREARQIETRKIVSGILWKRIKIGMALQTDAVFGYIHGISGYSPTLDDYKIDSPYNTYRNRGLPPGPISNPGLETIDAALHPTETPYLYYLTGSEGTMHYAKTFAEHVANRKYLK